MVHGNSWVKNIDEYRVMTVTCSDNNTWNVNVRKWKCPWSIYNTAWRIISIITIGPFTFCFQTPNHILPSNKMNSVSKQWSLEVFPKSCVTGSKQQIPNGATFLCFTGNSCPKKRESGDVFGVELVTNLHVHLKIRPQIPRWYHKKPLKTYTFKGLLLVSPELPWNSLSKEIFRISPPTFARPFVLSRNPTLNLTVRVLQLGTGFQQTKDAREFEVVARKVHERQVWSRNTRNTWPEGWGKMSGFEGV